MSIIQSWRLSSPQREAALCATIFNESSNSWRSGESLHFFAYLQHHPCWKDNPRNACRPCCPIFDEIVGKAPDGKLKVNLRAFTP